MNQTDEHKVVLGYVRVSTQEQADEGVSLEAQQVALGQYCKLRGLELADVVVDAGVSAGKPLARRPGGAELVAAIRSGRVAGVVALKLDRLFRSTVDCLNQTADWNKRGVALHLLDMGGQSVDTSSAMGAFFLTVLAAVGTLERGLAGERTATALQHKRSKGEHTGGSTPYGWKLAADGVHLEPNLVEQQIVVSACKLREAGLSLRKIGRELELQGLVGRGGGTWNPNSVRSLLKAKVAA